MKLIAFVVLSNAFSGQPHFQPLIDNKILIKQLFYDIKPIIFLQFLGIKMLALRKEDSRAVSMDFI